MISFNKPLSLPLYLMYTTLSESLFRRLEPMVRNVIHYVSYSFIVGFKSCLVSLVSVFFLSFIHSEFYINNFY
jgi:hypothetical protein